MSEDPGQKISLKRPKGYFKSSTLSIPRQDLALERFRRRSRTSTIEGLPLGGLNIKNEAAKQVQPIIPEGRAGSEGEIFESPPHSITLRIEDSSSRVDVGIVTEENPVDAKFGFSKTGDDSIGDREIDFSKESQSPVEIYSNDRDSIDVEGLKFSNFADPTATNKTSGFNKPHGTKSLMHKPNSQSNYAKELRFHRSMFSSQNRGFLKKSTLMASQITQKAIAKAEEKKNELADSPMIRSLVQNEIKKSLGKQKIEFGIERRVTTLDWNPKKEESWQRFNQTAKMLERAHSEEANKGLGLSMSRFGQSQQATLAKSGFSSGSGRKDSGIIRWVEETGNRKSKVRGAKNHKGITRSGLKAIKENQRGENGDPSRNRRSVRSRRKIRMSKKKKETRKSKNLSLKAKIKNQSIKNKHNRNSQTNQNSRPEIDRVMQWTREKIDLIEQISKKEKQLKKLRATTRHMISKIRDLEIRSEFQRDFEMMARQETEEAKVLHVPKINSKSKLLKRLEKGSRKANRSQIADYEPTVYNSHNTQVNKKDEVGHILDQSYFAPQNHIRKMTPKRRSRNSRVTRPDQLRQSQLAIRNTLNNSQISTHQQHHISLLSSGEHNHSIIQKKSFRSDRIVSSVRSPEQSAKVTSMLIRLNEQKFLKKKNIYLREKKKLIKESRRLDLRIQELRQMEKEIQDLRKREIQSNIFRQRREAIEKRKQIKEGNKIVKQLLYESRFFDENLQSKKFLIIFLFLRN